MKAEIIIASDTHGAGEYLNALEKAYPKADLMIHCGDLEDYPERYPGWLFVRGNNDMIPSMPDSRVLKICGVGIYVTHSHFLSYRKRTEQLALIARENNCQIALFGHTHVPLIETVHGVLLINPGSMVWPRDGKSPSFARLVIEDDGSFHARIIREEDWPFHLERKRWF